MTQLVVSPDVFAHGTPVYGDVVAGYLNCSMDTALRRRLHDGYGGACAMQTNTGAAYTTRGTAFARRELFPENVRVRAVVRKDVKTGTALASHLLRHGVYCRITAGTINDATLPSVFISNPTCYGFEIDEDGDGTHTLRLLRIVAGARTVIASVTSEASFPGSWISDHEMILTAETEGDGSVTLTAQIGGFYYGATAGGTGSFMGHAGGPGSHGGSYTTSGQSKKKGAVPLVPPDAFIGPPPSLLGGGGASLPASGPVTVLTFSDPAVSAIADPGRVAFLIDNERLVGTAKTISICSAFTVEDVTDPAEPLTVFRDEFSRVALKRAEVVTDLHGTAGRVIADDYSTGRFSLGLATADLLRRDTGAERADILGAMSFGSAADGSGSAQSFMTSQPAGPMFAPGDAPAVDFQVTVAAWLRVDDNKNFGIFCSSDGASIDGTEWEFQWIDAGASTFQLRMKTATGTYATGAIAEAGYVGSTHCYVMTYKARANPTTGEGRVRIYAGKGGQTFLLVQLTVPAADRPTFAPTDVVRVGRELPGLSCFDGRVDGLSVIWREATLAEVELLSNQAFSQQNEVADIPNYAHGCDFNTHNFSTVWRFKPFFPVVSSTPGAEWWQSSTGFTQATGILPDIAASRVATWDERGELSAFDQTRSLNAILRGAFSTIGIILRGTQATAGHSLGAGASGYLVEVGIGSPTAPVNLYRINNGVATRLARQIGALAVTINVAFTLEVSVQRQSGGTSDPAVISVQIGGTTVLWEIDGSVVDATTSVDSDAVIDVSSERVVGGSATGFVTAVDTTATDVDDWTRGSLPAIDAAAELASAGLPQEEDGITGNLATVFQAEYVTTGRVSTTRRADMLMEDGHSRRWLLDTYEPRAYSLGSNALTDAEKAALQAFYDAHMPRASDGHFQRRVPFSWAAGNLSDIPNEYEDGSWVFSGPLLWGRSAGVACVAKHTVRFQIDEVVPAL